MKHFSYLALLLCLVSIKEVNGQYANPYDNNGFTRVFASPYTVTQSDIQPAISPSKVYEGDVVFDDPNGLNISEPITRTFLSEGESIHLTDGTTISPVSNGEVRLIVADPSCYEGGSTETLNLPNINLNNPEQKGGWTLIFQDEFNGTELDLNKWRYLHTPQNQDSDWYTEPGTEREYCAFHRGQDGTNVEVSNGTMKLKAIHENYFASWVDDDGMPHNYNFLTTTPSLSSHQVFHYGYFEARLKMPTDSVHWPAFWLFGGPGWQEIDIIENVGALHGEHKVNTNIHLEGAAGSQYYDNVRDDWQHHHPDYHMEYLMTIPLSQNINIGDDWITMGCLYEEGKISIYINNQLARVFTCMGDEQRLTGADQFNNAMEVRWSIAMQPGYQESYDESVSSGTLSDPMEVDYFRYYQKDESVSKVNENHDKTLVADVDKPSNDHIDELVMIDVDGANGGILVYDVDNDQQMNEFDAAIYPEYVSYLHNDSKFYAVNYDGNGEDLIMINSFDKEEAVRIVDLETGYTLNRLYNNTLFLNFLDFEDRYFLADYTGNGKDELIMINTSQHDGEEFLRVIELKTGNILKSINYLTPTDPNGIGITGWVDLNDKIFLKDLNQDGRFKEMVFVTPEVAENMSEHIRVLDIETENYLFSDHQNSHLGGWIDVDDKIMIGDVDNADPLEELVVVKRNPQTAHVVKVIDLTNGNLKFNVANGTHFDGFQDYCDYVELLNLQGDEDEDLVFVNTSGDLTNSNGQVAYIYDFDFPNTGVQSYNFSTPTFNQENYFLDGAEEFPGIGDRILKGDGVHGTVSHRESIFFLNTQDVITYYLPDFPIGTYKGLGVMSFNGFTELMDLAPEGNEINPDEYYHQFSNWQDGTDFFSSICSGYNSVFNKNEMLLTDSLNTAQSVLPSIFVYPNPAKDMFNIRFDSFNEEGISEITVYDLLGRPIIQLNTSNHLIEIETSDLSKGGYILQVKRKDLLFIERIIKE